MADNVECLLEDSVIPGVTKATVLQYLESSYHADGNKVVYGRSQVRLGGRARFVSGSTKDSHEVVGSLLHDARRTN